MIFAIHLRHLCFKKKIVTEECMFASLGASISAY